MTQTFDAVLANSLLASLTNTFVWFAVTFWVYLQTRSVLAMSVMGTANGVSFLVASVFSGMAIGFLGAYWMLVFAFIVGGLMVARIGLGKSPLKLMGRWFGTGADRGIALSP